jgi:general stress protein 26
MDSINRNQPEENRDNLQAQEAIEKIKELVEKGQNCFFRTTPSTDQSNGARPMNVRQVDDEGNLWFLIAKDSFTYQDLTADPSVELFFQGSKHSDFLHLKGQITISCDQEKLKDLWEPVIRTWFTGGIDDPRIAIIQVEPLEGYYWDTKHGNAVAGIKMMIGAVLRKTLDDSIEGKLKVTTASKG